MGGAAVKREDMPLFEKFLQAFIFHDNEVPYSVKLLNPFYQTCPELTEAISQYWFLFVQIFELYSVEERIISSASLIGKTDEVNIIDDFTPVPVINPALFMQVMNDAGLFQDTLLTKFAFSNLVKKFTKKSENVINLHDFIEIMVQATSMCSQDP